MRKVMSLSIVAVLVLVATSWAMTASQEHDGFSGTRINTFEMMSVAADLPVHQYDAI
jgi:hypothetical protein